MIIANLAHASTFIPNDIAFALNESEVKAEAFLMADLYTDRLVPEVDYITKIQAKVSRIVVDTERFIDDNAEPASRFGMGVVYQKTHEGRVLRNPISEFERQDLIEKYYIPHHEALEKATETILIKYNKAFILDIHSYPCTFDILGIKNKATPDICIGFEAFHKNEKVLNLIIDFCQQNGFSYAMNDPFAGSIVPLKYYQKNSSVCSFMIEIKRDLYMDEQKFTIKKGFISLRNSLEKLFYEINQTFLTDTTKFDIPTCNNNL